MAEDGYRVFLSSTSDLEEERREVADKAPLSFRIYRYERDRPRRQSPEERLRDVLAESDVFIGLFGERYGSLYPDCTENPSIVEWEFDTAKGLPCDIQGFVRDPLDCARLEEPQKQFLARLKHFREGSWLGSFGSPLELTRDVNTALLAWLAEVHAKEKEAWERERRERAGRDRTVRSLLGGTAAMMTGAAVAAAVLYDAWWAAAGVLLMAAVLLFVASSMLAPDSEERV